MKSESVEGSPLSTLDQQKESLDRLTHLIFQMEVRYISKLVANKYKSDADLDTDLLANHVTFEFLDRYLNCHGREMIARLKVEPLLKRWLDLSSVTLFDTVADGAEIQNKTEAMERASSKQSG